MLQELILNTLEKFQVKYTLWKNGAEAKFLCLNPEHKDTSASCSINLETGIFGCFGCGYKGNVTQFLKALTGENIKINDILSETEQFDFVLKKVYSNSIENIMELDVQQEFEKLLSFETENFVSATRNEIAYSYLKNRKFSDESIRKFRLQYAIRGQYQNRIIIPYILKNKYIGFNARLISVDKQNKSELRYRYHINKQYLEKFIYNYENLDWNLKYCILVEGPFDLIYSVQCGLKNVISTLNTNISILQMKEIMKFDKIIFCFDNDRNSSGMKSVLKHSSKMLDLMPSIECYFVKLPEGKDPNECTKEELLSSFSKLHKIKLEE